MMQLVEASADTFDLSRPILVAHTVAGHATCEAPHDLLLYPILQCFVRVAHVHYVMNICVIL